MFIGKSVMFIAIIICFIGFFYLGVAQGQGDFSTIDKKDTNYKGGIAGVMLGFIIFVIGWYVNMKLI